MMNQRDALPDKTLVKETKFKIVRRNEFNHTLNCKREGFITIRHNNIRHFEANLSKQVHIKGGNTNGLTGDDARQNITVKTVWRNGQNAYSLIFALQTLNANFQNHLSEF